MRNLPPDVLRLEKIDFTHLSTRKDSWFDDLASDYICLGFRWVDGEIANDLLLLQLDKYSESEQKYLKIDGQNYHWDFDIQVLKGFSAWIEKAGFHVTPKAVEIAMRYMIEFDATFSIESLHVGGKWQWGNAGYRPKKREPAEFVDVWGAYIEPS
jgi:hypothetical protein